MISLIFVLFIISTVRAHCSENCVLSSHYWIQNENKFEFGDGNAKLWPTSCNDGKGISEFNYIFNKTAFWSSIISSKRKNICVDFAKQYITINLNICRGTCVNREIYNGLIEASDILDTQCTENGFSNDIDTKKRHRLNVLNQLFIKYNIGEISNEKCGISTKQDCNKNDVVDSCEIGYSYYLELCKTEQGMASTLLNTCKMYKETSSELVCKILNKGTERDCNNNAILDSCEITSINYKYECSDPHCTNYNNIYDFPRNCLGCKSYDLDNDGIPDMCQNYEFILDTNQHFKKDRTFTDCNSDGIDDTYSILLGTSSDVNNNGIPDDCEFGSCCGDGICFDTTIDKCNNETFIRGMMCSSRYDCFVEDKNERVGSCCRRTSGVSPILLCENSIKYGDCENVSGFWSKDECKDRYCGSSLGSCCSNYNSTCYASISYDTCSELTSQMFIFDKKKCNNKDCLCRSADRPGTCVHSSGNCIENVTALECNQLMGVYDNIDCDLRLDLKEDRIGSCCMGNNDCIDRISRYKCISQYGSFSVRTCGELNFCNKEILEECCVDNVGYCLPKRSSDCSGMLGNFSSVRCIDYSMCNLIYHASEGCCLLNKKCLKSINEAQCLFFNGTFMNSTECLTNKFCYDNVFAFEVITKTQSNGISNGGGDRNANIAINSNSTSAVVTITIFSIISGLLFSVFVIYSFIILYNRPNGN